MRTCSKATKAKLAKIPHVFPNEQTRVAYYDAMNGKPMSTKRERRLLVEMGIAKPPRRFYRPCLPVELGEQVKLWNIDVEALLTQAVKHAIADAEWDEWRGRVMEHKEE